MDRTPAFLAAIASAAVRGLEPVSAQALRTAPGESFDIGLVSDAGGAQWVVRAPRDEVSAVEMERTTPLLGLLARRLPFAVPEIVGLVGLADGGHAAVYPHLSGEPIDLAAVPPGPGLAAELGRALAALHDIPVGLVEESGLPVYDAEEYRQRRLAQLDQAAETGRVPRRLLSRWEEVLEDVALWRFAPTLTHGHLVGDSVLAVFTDRADAASGRVAALVGWERAQVADPADDFAALVEQADPATVDSVLEAYSVSRSEVPDARLLERAGLAAEVRPLTRLLAAVRQGDQGGVEVLTAQLRRIDDETSAPAAVVSLAALRDTPPVEDDEVDLDAAEYDADDDLEDAEYDADDDLEDDAVEDDADDASVDLTRDEPPRAPA